MKLKDKHFARNVIFSELFVEVGMGSRWLKPVLMNYQKQKNHRNRKFKNKEETPEEKTKIYEKRAVKKAQDRKGTSPGKLRN